MKAVMLFSGISIEARTLLALIFDRMELSQINAERFTDKHGRIYVIYTLEEVSRKLGCSLKTGGKFFKELEKAELIIRRRDNRTLPARIYLTEKFFDLLKSNVTNCKNFGSRTEEIKPHEVKKIQDSNNNIINNDMSNNKSSTGTTVTEDEIKMQIDYESLVYEGNRKRLDQIVTIICDVLCAPFSTVRIGKKDIPKELVAERFRMLDSEHIFSILWELENSKEKIRNFKAYLTSVLYNTPAEFEAEIENDFARYMKSFQ